MNAQQAIQSLSSIPIDFNYWILQSIAMGITCFLIRGLSLSSPLGALFIVLGLAFVNSFAWDAALFFSIPDRFTYHAALLLLMNGLIFWLLVKLLPGIEVRGILPALIAPVVFTITSMLIEKYGNDLSVGAVFQILLHQVQELKEMLLSAAPATEHAALTQP
ncbi:MAG: phage holin family protein [Deltaproteobacteria bacterium]|nr:phage holin family protein [Deltaproteobacteria bacterium]